MQEISFIKVVICIISLALSTCFRVVQSNHRTWLEFVCTITTSAAAIFLMVLVTKASGTNENWSYVFIFLSGLSGAPIVKMLCDKFENYVKLKFPDSGEHKDD